MKQYLDLVKTILEFGEKKTNRTGVNTLDQFAHQIKFDLRKGFPLGTTRLVNFKPIVAELLWFIKGSQNVNELREIQHGTGSTKMTIWDANYENQGKLLGYFSGYLGKIYGQQWRGGYKIDFDNIEVVKIPDRIDDEYKEIKFQELKVELDDEFCGREFISNQGKKYKVIRKDSFIDKPGHNKYYLIQFFDTLSYKVSRLDAILEGRVKDNFEITHSGVGKLGNIPEHTKKHKLYKILFRKWAQMLARCYDTSCKEYQMYGKCGVTVCKRWHTLSNFLEDVQCIPGFDNLYHDSTYQIDKDILGSKMYSKQTCMIIPKFYNQQLVNSKPIIYKDKIYINKKDFCLKHGWASISGLKHHLTGRYTKKYKDVKYLEIPDGYYYRYKTVKTDQLKEAIELIKNSPDSRRILVNCWQIDDLRKMALPPCHYGFQFNVSADGQYLDLLWTQRSWDLGCGAYFNIASYALLLSIVAQITNKTPRFLTGQLGSCHIYENHLDSFKEQLTREPLELPTLKISDKIKTLDDVENSSIDDYQILNYNHHPKLKFEMVV